MDLNLSFKRQIMKNITIFLAVCLLKKNCCILMRRLIKYNVSLPKQVAAGKFYTEIERLIYQSIVILD